MRLFLLGKRSSVTGWLEESAAAFRSNGHAVQVGFVRNPWISASLEAALIEPIGARLANRVKRFGAELVLAVGGFHVPPPILERLASLQDRPPMVGWVGDLFDESAASLAALYDIVAYTDSGLLARHKALGFASEALFAPHAVNSAIRVPTLERRERVVFVANPTLGRLAATSAIQRPIALYGQGWPKGPPHEVHARRVAPRELPRLYAGHLASLNVRNELNVLNGLNQRHFQAPLARTPLVSDAQEDLELCFEPGREVFVWRDFDELNEVHNRIIAYPEEAKAVGEAARHRILAEHSFGARLETILRAL